MQIGDWKMTHDFSGIRSMRIIYGKGGPHVPYVVMRGDLLSGYMYPKLHRSLRRMERSKKRKNTL